MTARLTGLATSGLGTANAVVGGNAANSTLIVNNSGANLFEGTLGGPSENQNNIALVKTNSGTLTLSGVNTYSGPTTISKGTLALGASGSINNTPLLALAPNATLDVSAIPSFSLSSSTALSATGTGTSGTTAAAIKGGTMVDLGSQPIYLAFTPSTFSGDTTHPSLYVSQGSLTLNGQITVTNNGAQPLSVGSYVLVSLANGTISGSPTLDPTIRGQGLVAGTVATLQVNGANLELLVTSATGAPTTLTLLRHAGTGDSTTYGDTLQFDVTVSPSTATGNVLLKTGGAGGTFLGSGTLAGGTCTITPAVNALSVGTHANIVAVYNGDLSYLPSTSEALSPAQTVAAKNLTVSSPTANNKYFDGTTAAIIIGTLAGVVSGDTISLVGTGTFANPDPGTAIAVTATCTLSGLKASNYTLTQPAGLTANIIAGGAVWVRQQSGASLWDGNTNWANTTLIPNGPNVTADFSTLNITNDMTVHLLAPKTIGSLIFGDTNISSAGGWTLSNSNVVANTLTFGGSNPVITVNTLASNKLVTIANKIEGTDGLKKDGPGILSLSGASTLSGGLRVQQGMLKFNNVGLGQLGAGAITLGGTGAVTLDFIGGFAIETNDIVLTGSGSGSVTLSSTPSSGVAWSGLISGAPGSGGLIFTGGGTVEVRNEDSTYSGGTILASGNVVIGGGVQNAGTQTPNSPANGRFGTGIVKFNGATIRTGASTERTLFNAIDMAVDTTIPTGGGALHLAGDITLNGTNGTRTLSQNSGSALYLEGAIKNGTSTNLLKVGSGVVYLSGASTYTGTLNIGGGGVVCSAANTFPSASALILSNNSWLDLAYYYPQSVRSFQLISGTVSNGSSSAAITSATDFDIRSGNIYGTLSGPVGLVKSTAGTVRFLYNTYTGPTLINAGILGMRAFGSIDSSSGLSIAPGATFEVNLYDPAGYTFAIPLTASGSGTNAGVDAATIVAATGGTISVGSQPLNLRYTPLSFVGDPSHPALYISKGNLSLNGTVNVTNLSATPLGAGSYVLATAPDGIVSGVPILNPVIGGGGVAPSTTLALQSDGSNLVLVVTSSLQTPTITLTRHVGTGTSNTYGDSLSFDVSVSPSGATGTVLLKDGGAAGTVLASATLTNGACTIPPPLNALTAGTHDNIVAVYPGDSGYAPATSAPLSAQTVGAKALTISGAAAQNKLYDGTTNATITGTLVGVVTDDTITLVGTGGFASPNVGNAIAVTAACTLSGAKASNYTVTQPTGLTANIMAGGVWTNLAGGAWETASNWLDSLIPAVGSASADFSTLDLAADTTVTLNAPKTAGTLVFGDADTNSAAGWLLSNNGLYTNTLTLGGTNPVISVQALAPGKAVVILNNIAGTNGLRKTGPGTLLMGGTNAFSGGLQVDGGELSFTNGNNAFSGGITLNSGALSFTTFNQINNNNLVLSNAGTFRLIGPNNATTDSMAVQLLAGGGVLEPTNGGATLRLGGPITGAGDLLKTGPGTLALGKNAAGTLGSTFTGKVLAKEGTLEVRNPDGLGAITGMTEIRNSTFALSPYGQMSDIAYNAEPLLFSGTTNIFLYRPNYAGQQITWTGLITNQATLSLQAGSAAPLLLNAPVVTTTGSALTVGKPGDIATTVTANGVISGPGTLTLQGAPGASLTLAAANTHTGDTTVEGGSLLLTGAGAFANSPVITVADGAVLDVSALSSFALGGSQTLKGSGTVVGNVTANGTLSPGASVGTLTFNNNLTIAGSLVFELDKSLVPSNDVISVAGSLSNAGAGTLTVLNLGTNLDVGDKFTLFSKPLANGRSLAIAAPAGVTFTNNLPEDGSITVLSVALPIPTNPTNITTSVTGKTLNLSWPADHLGWLLQTNAVSVADTNSWFTYPGSASVTNVAISIDSTKKNVFFRLVYPR